MWCWFLWICFCFRFFRGRIILFLGLVLSWLVLLGWISFIIIFFWGIRFCLVICFFIVLFGWGEVVFWGCGVWLFCMLMLIRGCMGRMILVWEWWGIILILLGFIWCVWVWRSLGWGWCWLVIIWWIFWVWWVWGCERGVRWWFSFCWFRGWGLWWGCIMGVSWWFRWGFFLRLWWGCLRRWRRGWLSIDCIWRMGWCGWCMFIIWKGRGWICRLWIMEGWSWWGCFMVLFRLLRWVMGSWKRFMIRFVGCMWWGLIWVGGWMGRWGCIGLGLGSRGCIRVLLCSLCCCIIWVFLMMGWGGRWWGWSCRCWWRGWCIWCWWIVGLWWRWSCWWGLGFCFGVLRWGR